MSQENPTVSPVATSKHNFDTHKGDPESDVYHNSSDTVKRCNPPPSITVHGSREERVSRLVYRTGQAHPSDIPPTNPARSCASSYAASPIRSLLQDRAILSQMYRVAIVRLRNTADAEDAVQTAALEALQSEDRGACPVRGRHESRRWLFGVARNIANNGLRRRTRIRRRHVCDLQESPVTPANAIDLITPEVRGADQQHLTTLLNGVNRKERELLLRAATDDVRRSRQSVLCRLRARCYQLIGRDKPTPRRGPRPHRSRSRKDNGGSSAPACASVELPHCTSTTSSSPSSVPGSTIL
jgi:DNA-directed RNA polymerase specialized sigma24 family protein